MRNSRELLIILAVLSALLVTGAGTLVRGSAEWKQAVCRDNLTRLQKAAANYQNDHDGFFQPVAVRTNPWTYWADFLRPYAPDPRIFSCPANPRGEVAFEDDDLLPVIFNLKQVSFGMNFCLSSSGEAYQKSWPANIRKVVNPSYIVYFGDSHGLQLRPTKACWETDYAPIHSGKSNFAMLDGHVETQDAATLGLLQPYGIWKQDVPRWRNWAKE